MWALCLLASGLASHRVAGTDLGPLFASIRPGAAPGAWHRFGHPDASLKKRSTSKDKTHYQKQHQRPQNIAAGFTDEALLKLY